MTIMIREVYEAENRFNKVETDLALLKWMVGFNLAVIEPLFSP
jgi:hypothetical protein